jgi:hypothetical protein
VSASADGFHLLWLGTVVPLIAGGALIVAVVAALRTERRLFVFPVVLGSGKPLLATVIGTAAAVV